MGLLAGSALYLGKPEQVELVAAMYEQYCGKAVINVDNLVKVVEVLEKEVGKLSKTKTTNQSTGLNQQLSQLKQNNVYAQDKILINAPVFPKIYVIKSNYPDLVCFGKYRL